MKAKFFNYKNYKEKYAELVELERKEEMERHENEIRQLSPREREEKGRALLRMKGRDEGKGLGGDHIVKFVRKGRNSQLPENEISVGDLVMVSKNQPLNPDNPTGTVIEKTRYSLTVGFPGKPPGFAYGKNLRVDLYVNDITYQRMLEALDEWETLEGEREVLRNIILGEKEPDFSSIPQLEMNNPELDESQQRAVEGALGAEDLFLIHGPPGTGKTTTLIEVIEGHIEKEDKVLATADSNVAVDNMVEFLNERGRYVVRVGHPARVTETLRKHTLDFLVEEKDKYKKAQKLRDKAEGLDDEQEKYTFPSGRWRRGMSDERILDLAREGKGSRGVPADKIESMAEWIRLQEEKNELYEKAEKLEDEAVDQIIESADVVLTTNSTAGSELMEGEDFDVVVIDEATQSTEPSCLIPMTHASKVVMAGDHKQLPPTILSEEAQEKGLEVTLFERLLAIYGDGIKRMLHRQYRMNTVIMDFPSEKFYEGELKAAAEVADHELNLEISEDGSSLKQACHPKNIVTFIDTCGEYGERTKAGSTSKENRGEAQAVSKIVAFLLKKGLKAQEIGVISPYDDQIDLLERKIDVEGLEIKTVDGFQGREKEVIVLSFVRSNDRNELGFLTDLRRLNVSITRARKKLIAIGDSTTLARNEVYKDLIEYIEGVEEGIKIELGSEG